MGNAFFTLFNFLFLSKMKQNIISKPILSSRIKIKKKIIKKNRKRWVGTSIEI